MTMHGKCALGGRTRALGAGVVASSTVEAHSKAGMAESGLSRDARSPRNFTGITRMDVGRLTWLELDGWDRTYTPDAPASSPHFAEERRKAGTEDPAPYVVKPAEFSQADGDAIIAQALAILDSRMRAEGPAMTSPQAVRDYLKLTLAQEEAESFVVVFLDGQNRLIDAATMFRGTLSQTAVYPREVVKAALAHNAASVILAHNHPSGCPEPSRADELLTQALKQALALIDVRTLDHFIVAKSRIVSFAERGLL